MDPAKNSIVRTIEGLALPIVSRQNAFIVDCVVRGERGSSVVELFIDAEQAVTTDLCASVSRDLSAAVEGGGIFPKGFNLVVSSPGTEKPLKLPRQYPKHVGRVLSVWRKDAENPGPLEGELLAADGTEIVLKTRKSGTLRLPFSHIDRAVVRTKW